MAIDDVSYRDWIARFDTLDDGGTAAARRLARSLKGAPRIDVVMPVFDPPEVFLREAIASVRRQIYENWTLCIVDDGSREPYVARVLAEAARADGRIRVHRLESNSGMEGATNAAIALGTGEFIAFLDHDDTIPPQALLLVAHRVVQAPGTNLVYSDFDFLDDQGCRTNPFFKPDYDRQVHWGLNLISSLTVLRRNVVDRVGGMRAGFPGSPDYELGLRIIEAIPESSIEHIPHVLYHWRMVQGSLTRAGLARAVDSAQRAVREHCQRLGQEVSITGTPRSFIWNRVRQIPREAPAVTLAVWGATRERMNEVRERYTKCTTYEHLSVSAVDPDEAGAAAAFRNEVVSRATTDLVVFVDARFTPRHPEWLTEMASHFSSAECAIVGGRTIGFDGLTEQCGLVLGLRDGGPSRPGGRAFHGCPEDGPSYFGRDEMAARATVVSGGVVVVRKRFVEAVGGFEERLTTALALDLDLCLSVASRGASVVFCPHAVFVASGPAPQEADADSAAVLREKWAAALDTDRRYNPNLTDTAPDFSLAFPPRVRFPWDGPP
jgi:cellulose synthase/poly-beta-1,6-N-acetylglucosamine synthase-like glycosyltransferase